MNVPKINIAPVSNIPLTRQEEDDRDNAAMLGVIRSILLVLNSIKWEMGPLGFGNIYEELEEFESHLVELLEE